MDAVSSDALDDLAARAGSLRVVVIGGGIAGLVAAWECAKIGMTVSVLEASDRIGGVIGSARIAGLDLELGATCWSTRGGVMRRLLDEVAPDVPVAHPRSDDEWIAGIPRTGAAPLPSATVLGIPANPWDEQVRRLIGWRGAWRAYVDRLRPPMTIGVERSLGRLVRTRMGPLVHDRLVAPLSVDRFGLMPDDVDVEIAAPALNPALTRTGSLAGAAAELSLDPASVPGYEGLVGGMPQLVAALGARLVERGAHVSTGSRVEHIERSGEVWIVHVAPGATSGGGPSDAAAVSAAASDPPAHLEADAVIVATEEGPARSLLAAALGEPALLSAADPGIAREVVTLVVDAPSLDAAPRGAHIHAIPGSHRATGVVHETARWGWLAEAAGAGRHVVRVAFGAPGSPPATEKLDDADARALAVREASALLGVPLDDRHVAGAQRARYTLVPPVSAMGRREATAALRADIARVPGLAAVGGWLSGSGLAQVVRDARPEADRLRRTVLWGGSAAK